MKQKDVPILDVIDVAIVRIPKPICTRQPDHSRKGKASGDIKTEIELHKAGYLKGEQIRLNIKIRHTKPIKIITGAIVTLYRMSRFDSPKYLLKRDMANFQGRTVYFSKGSRADYFSHYL